MTGGVPGHSVLDNALAHVGKRTLVKLDLRNHFGCVSNAQVFAALREELGMSTEVAGLLTKLTTLHSRLPQGAPTSSALANLVFLPAHRAVSELALRCNLSYTVFVDDLSLSGEDPRLVLQDIIKILQNYQFAITARKIKIFDRNERQETTGLVVNSHVAVGRTERQFVREEVVKALAKGRISEKTHAWIWGKIQYISFINRKHGEELAELARKLPSPSEEVALLVANERFPCRSTAKHRYRGNDHRI